MNITILETDSPFIKGVKEKMSLQLGKEAECVRAWD